MLGFQFDLFRFLCERIVYAIKQLYHTKMRWKFSPFTMKSNSETIYIYMYIFMCMHVCVKRCIHFISFRIIKRVHPRQQHALKYSILAEKQENGYSFQWFNKIYVFYVEKYALFYIYCVYLRRKQISKLYQILAQPISKFNTHCYSKNYLDIYI